MVLSGWLFDAYPAASGVTVWLIDGEGTKHRARYPFQPAFYVDVREPQKAFFRAITRKYRCHVSREPVEKIELYSNRVYPVTEVQVQNPMEYRKVIAELSAGIHFYQFYNADLKPGQMFYYTTQLFPLAYGEYEIVDGVLVSWSLRDSFDAETYTIPPLIIMSLTPSETLLAPKYQRSLTLEIEVEGRRTVLQQDSPEELLEGLNSYLAKYDPDVLLTSYGDAALFPLLTALAQKHKAPLSLNRDASVPYVVTTAMSYFTYGQIKHREGAFELAGRWHLDKENSFIINESELDGLYDLSRLSQTSVQRQARTSIGSALASMQLSWAYRHNVLIPYKRPVKEEFKSFSTLLVADRGGLHFMPKIGFHEQVAELDFASMYPSLMRNHNISPETLNCRCCPQTKTTVPEIGYRICEKRKGLVAETLTPILAKRAKYKELKKQAPTEELRAKYDHMQSALKWILVTCFGYLGFKKSRMGRIEAHEAVNAYSRYGILKAKEIAEAEGFELIHAIVDCVWLKKEGASRQEYERLCEKIEEEVGVKISLEGIYNWILFPASKMDPELPTATRYVGVYDTGEMKLRGIEARRRDTPKFVRQVQTEVLDVFAGAKSVGEIRERIPERSMSSAGMSGSCTTAKPIRSSLSSSGISRKNRRNIPTPT